MTKFISNVNKYLSEQVAKQLMELICSFAGVEYDSNLLNILQTGKDIVNENMSNS